MKTRKLKTHSPEADAQFDRFLDRCVSVLVDVMCVASIAALGVLLWP